MKNGRPDSYWRILVVQYRKSWIAVVALFILLVFFLVALSADFIANDKPLIMKYRGEFYFPAVQDYAVWLGISRWDRNFQNVAFKQFARTSFGAGDWVQFPPIPYSPNETN